MGIFGAGFTRGVLKGVTGIGGTSFRNSLLSSYFSMLSSNNKNLTCCYYSILYKNHNLNNLKALTNYSRINNYTSEKLKKDNQKFHKDDLDSTLESGHERKESSQVPGKNAIKDKEFICNARPKEIIADESLIEEDETKLGLFRRFKLMYKRYWYVLIPVHLVTSAGWFGGFYYLSKSGVDIASVLQSLHLSETVIEKLKDSNMGHMAVAYLCYKIATPLRYAVTLGGTTVSIKHLSKIGYIKPIPSKMALKKMYIKKKEEMKSRREEK